MISIAVLMPTKNSVKWLDEVLFPLTVQTVDCDVKLILVDGYSSDGTVEKAREYFPDLIVRYDVSRNLAKARNICLDEGRKLKTDYMSFIDSDVIVPINYFERMITHLENPDVAISALRFELEHDPPEYFVSKHYRNRTDIKREGVHKTDYTTTACSMWKSELSDKVRLDERFKRAGEDVDFNLQLIEKGDYYALVDSHEPHAMRARAHYYALVDSNEPHAIHIRPATIKEELHRVKDHGIARALLMKLHRKSLDPMRYKKTILAAILTLMGWMGLILTPFLGKFWMIGLTPFSVLFLRHWMKTRDKRRLDYAFFGFLMSTIYLTRFIQGVIKYRNE